MRTSARRANRGIEFVRLESDAPKIGAVFFVRYAVGLGGAQAFQGGENAGFDSDGMRSKWRTKI